MAERNFDEEFDLASRKGHSFVFGGHEFHTRAVLHPSFFLKRAIGVEGLIEFLENAIVPEDRDVLHKLLDDPDALISADQLGAVVSWLVGELSGRPTGSPTSSGSGGEQPATSTS